MSRINYTRRGIGRPLLMVHGLGSNARTWDPLLPALKGEREVIAIDLPGFGESAPLDGEVTIASLTDATQAFLDEHQLGDVDVVGSSMGARIALELARRGHGGTVVALDPGGFWTDRQVKVFAATIGPSIALIKRVQLALPALTGTAVGRTALLLQFSARPWRLDKDVVLRELRGFASSASVDDAFHALVRGPRQLGAPAGSLTGKVVIGWGRNDRVTPPSQARCATARFPDASLHWFESCGHFPHWDQPEETARLILQSTRDTVAQS